MPKGQQRGNREAKKPKKDAGKSIKAIQALAPQAPSASEPPAANLSRKKPNGT
jgi:hypothetical protein